MTLVNKTIRIEPAFDYPEQVRHMFERYAPYHTLAAYAMDGVFRRNETRGEAKPSVPPWFRGEWADGGKPLVDGAEAILHNKKFVEAAKAFYGASVVRPEFVVVNVNAPMPAGATHVDVPSFNGATRRSYPSEFLVAMGHSGLFEAWRIVRAGVVTWFYEGTGGSFDYWPEGLGGPMRSEQGPFSNVALLADNDQMYHRIGPIGDPNAEPFRISPAAHIQPDGKGNWTILENGEVRAIYPSHAIRLSILWKAEVRDRESNTDDLTLDRVMEIFTADLCHRSVDFQVPSDPLADTEWVRLLQRIYMNPINSGRKQ